MLRHLFQRISQENIAVYSGYEATEASISLSPDCPLQSRSRTPDGDPILASMDESDLQILANHITWQQVLEAYLQLAAAAPIPSEAAPDTGPRWFGRLYSVPGVSSDTLPSIHGQLIAYGWLHFQMEDGQGGLTYRVSPEGRRLLKQVANLTNASNFEEESVPEFDLAPSFQEECVVA
ncbi:hypothetical protein [Planctomicrobium sp. SH527]|uniref:hypothetical protein n=1 Tax=Planctomicrobium sp. SH527 TaxID=3448123 RepID=UPI003F5B8275